jgi:signal transduction histidine kinase
MAERTLVPAPAAEAAPPKRCAPRRPIASSLSSRLLIITLGFLLLIEVALFVPLVGRTRWAFLNEKLATAHLIATALDAYPANLEPIMRDDLLSQGRMLGMVVQRPDMPTRRLDPGLPPGERTVYDLGTDNLWDQFVDIFATLLRSENYIIDVVGPSPLNPTVNVEAVIDSRFLRDEMLAAARRIFLADVIVFLMTAVPLYLSLQWLAVRPLRRLTASMTGFQSAPEDPRKIIVPSTRTDEVGVAEQTLAAMQQELRAALLQKERLAGVGTAVTKISHDLKNILATAMLESERLEQLPDPEVRRLTAGMVRSVDRAVQLSASTLRFAKDGLPEVNKQPLRIAEVLDELKRSSQAYVSCEIATSYDVDFAFDADPELLRRAFENLLRNACQAGAKRVLLEAADEDGYRVVRVSDDAGGLPSKALDNLFVPFAGSTRAGGFGLGLPIARELLRVQGGDISLLSTSPEGTCFVVRLPL